MGHPPSTGASKLHPSTCQILTKHSSNYARLYSAASARQSSRWFTLSATDKTTSLLFQSLELEGSSRLPDPQPAENRAVNPCFSCCDHVISDSVTHQLCAALGA